MLTPTHKLLRAADAAGYAVGAFNVYNLEGVLAVVAAAEAERSPAMLQVHPSSLAHGGKALVAMCVAAAQNARVPMSVHLDHSSSAADIGSALEAGMPSVMADGSHLEYAANVAFTKEMAALVHARGGSVEAELGRLTGTEDDMTTPENLSKLTDPAQAARFVIDTGIDALAVCIGNVHGKYRGEPSLDFDRLGAIRAATPVPLVLHGASGLPEGMIARSIKLRARKFNVNTEVREAYVASLRNSVGGKESPDLLKLMKGAVEAMQEVVAGKIRMFGSAGRA
ncbi:MAG: class II fructose-bisphosphate aldolase [SAR202 cluster bacterium]|nr:class II fructose-bisphosphate aldolase [SAR202 cluster bacterium]